MFKFFKTITKKLKDLFSKTPDEATFDHLEKLFFEADLGAQASLELVEKLRHLYKKNPQITPEETVFFIKEELAKELISAPVEYKKPHVILLVGVNGSGKTTTVAKLAAFYAKQGKKVLIAAGDTFRAAAIEQLETWATKLGVNLIKSQPNSDPSGVAFDAVAAATAREMDILLIDSAGRLQTKTDLMQELGKVRRVIQKQLPDAPHETLLVVDATIGQNAIDQARTFNQFTPLSGIVLTKLDGSAKGGIAISIQKELRIPIQWMGTGEKEGDLEPFDKKSYIDALFVADS